jgi:hypothetical protein
MPSAASLPKLDYAAAPKGHVAPKGKPATSSVVSPKSALTTCTGTPALCYFYSIGKQTQSPTAWTADGLSANIGVNKPILGTGDYHSLTEMSAQNGNNNIVELGVNVDPSVYGNSNPHMFAFNWVNGVAGCYNGCGFVPAVGCNAATLGCIGSDVTAWIGTTKSMAIQHLSGAWWLANNGVWIGAFPDSDWGATPMPNTTIHQLFWEVATNNTTPLGEMGNGILGAVGPPATGGNINSYAFVNVVPSTVAPSLTYLTAATGGGVPNSSKYNVVGVTLRSFRGGGPGW